MVYTVCWQMGAQGRGIEVRSFEQAVSLARGFLARMADAADRCHVRIVEGPIVWGKLPRALSHYTHDRGTAWRLVAGSPLPEPVAAAAE